MKTNLFNLLENSKKFTSDETEVEVSFHWSEIIGIYN